MSACVPVVAASINRSIAVSSAPHAMTVLNSCAIRSAASFNVSKVRPLAHRYVPRSSGSTCSSPAQLSHRDQHSESALKASSSLAAATPCHVKSSSGRCTPVTVHVHIFVAVRAAREHTDGQFAGSDGDAPFHALH